MFYLGKRDSGALELVAKIYAGNLSSTDGFGPVNAVITPAHHVDP